MNGDIYNLEAEQLLLGGILLDNEVLMGIEVHPFGSENNSSDC